MRFKNIFVLVLFLFSFVFLFSDFGFCDYKGKFEVKIISPLGNTIAHESKELNIVKRRESFDKGSDVTIFDFKLDDFAHFDTDENVAAIGKPYCRIGGWYQMFYSLDADGGSSVGVVGGSSKSATSKGKYDVIGLKNNLTENLYYCKTTRDLIENVQIPINWLDSLNLHMYCNDAKLINPILESYSDGSINFDSLVINNIDAYKICIVKNFDFAQNNTLIFGFETGNFNLDNNQSYYFDSEKNTSPFLVKSGLKYFSGSFKEDEKILSSKQSLSVSFEEFLVDKKSCKKSKEGGKSCKMVKVLDTSFENVKKVLKEKYLVELDDEMFANKKILDYGGSEENKVMVFDLLERNVVRFVGDYVFLDSKTNKKFYFSYKGQDKYFVLSPFKFDTSSFVNIDKVFNKNFVADSRIAYFRKIGDKKVYGVETSSLNFAKALNVKFFDSIKPVYRIGFKDLNFEKEDCENFLKSYNLSSKFSSLNKNSQIFCTNSEILIISENINSQRFDAFNLFKNIMTNIYLKDES